MTNATKVTEEYPGEGKGVLEILANPWDESKAMLLVEGSDEWGVKAGRETLVNKGIKVQTAVTEIELEEIKIAKNFASNYTLELYTQQVSNHFVLQNTQQIPYLKGDLKNPDSYTHIVSPPTVTRVNDSYIVELYTWTEYGGVLSRWKIKVEKQIITHIRVDVVDTHVGHFVATPAEGFIPSPGTILADEKIKWRN